MLIPLVSERAESGHGHPVFVTGINPEENKIIIGENDELFQRALYASNVNLMSRASLDEPVRLTAQIRYAHKAPVHSQTVAGRKFICAVLMSLSVRSHRARQLFCMTEILS